METQRLYQTYKYVDVTDMRQIAFRQGNELYYTLPDPAGLSQTVVDENGVEMGRILYDSFGGVITNSLPVTLTTPFANLPDAATGLVHVGNGRWYDPAIGRPLQPNPMGGPPALPQALNRYAATPLGQPGVYEAEQSAWNPFTDDFISNIGKGIFSTAVNEAAVQTLYRYFQSSAFTTIGDPIVDTVIKTTVKSELAEQAIIHAGAAGLFVSDAFPAPLQRLGRSAFDKVVILNTEQTIEEIIVGYSFRYEHRLPLGRVAGKLLASKIGLYALDAGIGFGIDVGYQIILDYNNPYLTNKQILQRAFIGQGSGSIVSFLGGGLVGGAFGGPAGIIVGIGISIIWDIAVAPVIYELIGAVPTRNLAPILE